VSPLDPMTMDLDGTSLIEASAGTGKTHTITILYLRLLLERRLQVPQILVVTFTNAATAELRARLRRRLRAAAAALSGVQAAQDDTLARLLAHRVAAGEAAGDILRLTEALYAFDEAAIFTIHGFCQRMLQENAFESGVPFGRTLVTDLAPLRDQIVADYWVRELHAAPEDFVRHVHDKPRAFRRLQHLAQLAMRDPEIVVLEPRAGAGDVPELEAQWDDLQQRFLTYSRTELRRREDEANTQSFDDLLQQLEAALRSPAGDALAQRIGERYRAALVDEFQDTDPIQYTILRRVFHVPGRPLGMIGDPKQAIFAFRGADVFAYLRAKRDARAATYTLPTNWRSAPRLIAAVNTIFASARVPFALPDIDFQPAAPAPGARDLLRSAAGAVVPLQILFVRRTRTRRAPKRNHLRAGWRRKELPLALAAHIADILESDLRIEDRAITAADIAVLCRTNDYARRMQAALRSLGVPTALLGDASVFDSGEAEELERVLRALAEPADSGALRAALATRLFGVEASRLVALQRDERQWDEWAEQFHRCHEIWGRHGFMPAFRRLLDECSVEATLLSLTDGERRLTNVLHLAELLQVAATQEQRGPLGLVDWLVQMRADPLAREGASEGLQIRLESDAQALKLVTIHRSKGLEYPIVVCPELWEAGGSDELTLFHDRSANDRLTLDLAKPAHPDSKAKEQRERLAESLRVLYVALTRARHLCLLTWGAFRGFENSALAYLLHQDPGASEGDDLLEGTRERLRNMGDDGLLADLTRLAEQAAGTIAIMELNERRRGAYVSPAGPCVELQSRQAKRRLSDVWRTSSFSGLIAARPASEPAEEGRDLDELPEDDATPNGAGAQTSGEVTLAEFPVGTRAGQLVHDVLEHLDFTQATDEAVDELVRRYLTRHGLDLLSTVPLASAVQEILDTPLEKAPDAPRLRSLSLRQRLSEMEFIFPVGNPGATFTAARLADVFRAHSSAVPADYPAQLETLGFAPLAGYLKGFVDLVFEHRGRWYVVDYKSNHLGNRVRDYALQRLRAAMADHQYFLQYHLYVVALHRYLQQRLPAYDYDRDFGCVYYLFLRGMRPERPGSGVFRDRPSRAIIEALSEALSRIGEQAA
jgi:exodeoxyribonuclease V beta subunit